MRPLTCIITDDEPLAVKLLESFVAKTPDLELLGAYTDSVEAMTAIKQQQPDLLFLDIQMPDINGMELARMLPAETRVIFTTAFQEYAFESYEVSALDFLGSGARHRSPQTTPRWHLPPPCPTRSFSASTVNTGRWRWPTSSM